MEVPFYARCAPGEADEAKQSASTLGYLKITRKRHCHKLVIGNWNITSLTESVYWSRKSNDIPWVLVASFQLNVVVLTLQSWMMDGNSSTPLQH